MAKVSTLLVALALAGVANAQIPGCKDFETINFSVVQASAGQTCKAYGAGFTATEQKMYICTDQVGSDRLTGCADDKCPAAPANKFDTACGSGADCVDAGDFATQCVEDKCHYNHGMGGKCVSDLDCPSTTAEAKCTNGVCEPQVASGATCTSSYGCPVMEMCRQLTQDASGKVCSKRAAADAYCQSGSECMDGYGCLKPGTALAKCVKQFSQVDGTDVGGDTSLCASKFTATNGKCASWSSERTGDTWIATGAEDCAPDANNCAEPGASCACQGGKKGKCVMPPQAVLDLKSSRNSRYEACMEANCPYPYSPLGALDPNTCAAKKCKAEYQSNECVDMVDNLIGVNNGAANWDQASEVMGWDCDSSGSAVAAGAATIVAGLAVAAMLA